MAAARQKEMKVRSAVVATMTRGIPLPRAPLATGLIGVVLIKRLFELAG
jgi:hypothetical protein